MNDELPDKDYLYGKYQRFADWRERLHKKLAHKSLDIAEDDDVHVDNRRTGIGVKEILAIGASLAGVGWVCGVADLIKPQVVPIVQPVNQSPGTTTTIERDYKIGDVQVQQGQ